jgi:hypothetical protein
MDFQYISIGYDCSPAGVLKKLELRTVAHPFDWTETRFTSLCACIQDDFAKFHRNIHLNSTKQRVIDAYGIQFPHDYPTIETSTYTNVNGYFYAERKLCDDYEKYTDQVVEKYGRRIERFRNAMADQSKPIIVLYRAYYGEAVNIKYLLERIYNRTNIIVIVATTETVTRENNAVIPCNPEENGKWNDSTVWLKAIESAKERYPILIAQPATNLRRFGLRF